MLKQDYQDIEQLNNLDSLIGPLTINAINTKKTKTRKKRAPWFKDFVFGKKEYEKAPMFSWEKSSNFATSSIPKLNASFRPSTFIKKGLV